MEFGRVRVIVSVPQEDAQQDCSNRRDFVASIVCGGRMQQVSCDCGRR
jgi:hypothetical protein